jgi:DNA adenine methylase
LSQREAAEEIGVRYKWLRRLCHHGLERIDKRTATNLEQVAEFFGVRVDDLWGRSIQQRPRPSSRCVLIKWMGSKRRQAKEIVSRFPKKIDTYYEPLIGSGAVLGELLASDIEVKRFRCSDICKPLIGIWNLVKADPGTLASRYEEMWMGLKSGGKSYYYKVRADFNKTGDPCQFFFLLRTCRIAFVEFSRKGNFVTPFQHGESGLHPEQVAVLLDEWNLKLRGRDVQFAERDYRTVFSRRRDFLYLDPPYPAKKQRLYYGPFDHDEFFSWLAKQRAGYALSFNGHEEGQVPKIVVPETLFDDQIQIDNETSAVRKLNGMPAPRVTDSLYVRSRGS